MTNRIFIFLILVFLHYALAAQNNSSDVIKNAVVDEIERNMKELSMDEHEDPFFIAFSIGDVETMSIVSILGSTITSTNNKARTNNCRVMVGDYKINDENFKYNSYNTSNDIGYLGLPIDNDYYGIRRAVWISVNNVYKSAAKKFKSKIKELERNNIAVDSLELEDFSKEEVVSIDVDCDDYELNDLKYESLANRMSAVFKGYSDIMNSSVSIFFYKSKVYFVNSEGTKVSFPMNLASISVDAASFCEDGTSISDNMTYIVELPQDLPEERELLVDVEKFAENLVVSRKAKLHEDTYEGPVLFQGNQVASVFMKSFFQGGESLIASREPLSLDGNSYGYYRGGSKKSRIGKKISHKDFSVTLYPKLKTYNGIKLIGSVDVDGEGVIPPDTLKLLENGKIVNLLNNRTPSREANKSNGHYRPNFSLGYLTRTIAPSVVFVETKSPIAIDSLKTKLINKAKEEELEYAIIFRTLDVNCSNAPSNAYKVDLETGEEELIRGLGNSSYRGYDLKEIMGVSENKVVVNSTLYGGYGVGASGVPCSIVCPDAILFEEMEYVGTRVPYVPDLPLMPSPLEEANIEKVKE